MDEYFIEEKSAWDKLLDFLVFIAVFVVTIFLIMEIMGLAGKINVDPVFLNEIYLYVNIFVFIIFAVDLVRLWKHASGFKDFMGKNWLDVIATIPFELIALFLAGIASSSQFGILKLVRLNKLGALAKTQKVSRIAKISKEFKAAAYLKKEGEEYQRKHRL